jgi:hypothetical protein
LLDQDRRRCTEDGDLYVLNGTDGVAGVAKILQGNIGDGIRWIEEAISQRDKVGYRRAADWCRLFLCEVYLQIVSGSEKVSLPTLVKNLPILVKISIVASARIRVLMMEFLTNPYFDPAGTHVGHAETILGLLYATKKRCALASEHLSNARRILSQFGEGPMLARVDAALAQLGQHTHPA